MPRTRLLLVVLTLVLGACGEEAATPPVGGGVAAPTAPPAPATPPAPAAGTSLAEQAAALYAAGDYAAVVALVRPAFTAGEASLRLRVLLGRSLRHLGQGEEATSVARSIVADDADHIEGNALLGELLLDAGQPAAAVPALEVVLRRVRKARWAVALGRAHLGLGEIGKAQERLEEALALGSHDPSVSYDLGRVYLSRGYGAKAERALQTCAESGGAPDDLDRLLAEALAAQAKMLATLTVVRSPADETPGMVTGERIIIARVADAADQAVASEGPCALLAALRHLARQPADPTCLSIAADAWLAAGRTEEAARHLDSLAATSPPPDLRRRRIALLIVRGDAAALAGLLADLTPDAGLPAPELAQAWHRLAVLQRAAGDPAAALTTLARADALDPANERILRARTALMLATRDPGSAAALRRLVELVPDAPDIEELRRRLATLATAGSEAP
jgi:tetratricopeptide (TPR) repeat protein